MDKETVNRFLALEARIKKLEKAKAAKAPGKAKASGLPGKQETKAN